MTFEDFKWTIYKQLAKDLENSMIDGVKLLFGYDNLSTVQCDELGITLEFFIKEISRNFKVFISNDCLANWQKYTDYENTYNNLYNYNPYANLENKIWWYYIVNSLNDIIKKIFLSLLTKGWKN